jgi:uroporphyrinogen III methyltransferase/synthase
MGVVYLVGAGPGDLKLITLKGLEVLKEADCVVYDHLINPNLLNFTKDDAKLIYVGKVAGNHSKTQEQINKILEDEARKVNIVVRLKGGDPFVFGRGGEEFDYLTQRGIKVEIIPGITSAIAAPAYAGIPVTQRGISSHFHVYTGHSKDTKIYEDSGTIVFLMVSKNIDFVKEKLLEKFLPDTPCAVINNGTTNLQKTYLTSIKDLEERLFDSPSLLVVGNVVKKRINWFEGGKLFRKKILITTQYSKDFEILEKSGAQLYFVPTFYIKENVEKLKYLAKNLDKYEILIFTSKNGVRLFLKWLKKFKIDLRSLKAEIAVIGEKTAKEFEKVGVFADIIPEKELSEKLFEMIDKRKKAAYITSNLGKDINEENIEKIEIYQTIENYRMKRVLNEVLKKEMDYVVFTSPSSFLFFLKMAKLNKEKICAIGPVTKKCIEDHGYKVEIMPKKYTYEELCKEILKKGG